MSPRLVWVVLKKDVRRSWWIIALTLVLLARLAHFDSLRDFATPGAEEGSLNLLLPVAWSFLLALVVLEDSVPGDSAFWQTAPLRWQVLLAAKSAFAIVAIHVPYFIACWAIVGARGFAPADYLPEILYRQFPLLALTLSSLALSASVRSVTRFMIVSIAVATAMAAAGTFFDRAPIQHLREIVVFSLVILVAAGITVSQYSRTGKWPVRAFGLVAMLVAAMIWRAPAERLYGLEAMWWQTPAGTGAPSVSLAVPRSLSVKRGIGLNSSLVAVPVTTTYRGDPPLRAVQGPLRIEDAEGNSWTGHTNPGTSATGPVVARYCCERELPDWQLLEIRKDVLRQIQQSPVTIKGTMLAQYYRRPAATVVPVKRTFPVRELGNCSSDIRTSSQMLHVDCESPRMLPEVEVVITDPSGREWKNRVGAARVSLTNSRGTWLSPVNRRDIFFSATDEEQYATPFGKWLIPHEVMDSVSVGIVPEISEGARVIDYELPNIRLDQYVVQR